MSFPAILFAAVAWLAPLSISAQSIPSSTGPTVPGANTALPHLRLPHPHAQAIRAAANTQQAATPQFSVAEGSYSSAQTITITDSTPGATIYYTTDGTYPAPGVEYTSPLAVSSSQVVTAVATAPGYDASPYATATYFIGSTPVSLIYTMAGTESAGFSGDGGPATAAQLGRAFASAADNAGHLYIADYNNRIRKVDLATGIISTIAGTGAAAHSGDGGPASAAAIWNPQYLAIDAAGNLYVGEAGDGMVRIISASTGNISTLGGNATYQLTGIACDSQGFVYVSTLNTILKVDPSDGSTVTYAGTGAYGYSGDGGPAVNATFAHIIGLAMDDQSNLYVSDGDTHVIRKIDAHGTISTYAGKPNTPAGGDGGPATGAGFGVISGMAVDAARNLYIVDTNNWLVRKIDAQTGIIRTVAGLWTAYSSTAGDGDPANEVAIQSPWSISSDAAGNLYISQTTRIREVTAPAAPPVQPTAQPTLSLDPGTYNAFQTLTITDTTPGAAIYLTFNGDTASTTDQLYDGPIDLSGSADIQVLAVAPGYLKSSGKIANYTVTKPPVSIISTIAGNGILGYSGLGGPAKNASIDDPVGITSDKSGNVYFTDAGNSVVWKISSGNINVIAGTGTAGNGASGGPPTATALNQPTSVAIDSNGNVFIADTGNNCIREIISGSGTMTTIAGPGTPGTLGDGGPAAAAYLNSPTGLAVDKSGNLYFADSFNGLVRKIDASTGIITTVAGGNSGGVDGGPAVGAYLPQPQFVAIDARGNLYIADISSSNVRFVNANTGIISTITGNGISGSGDGGLAVDAQINPWGGLAVDADNNVYIGDWPSAVRRIDAATGIITRVAGNGYAGFSGDGGSATVASLCNVRGVAVIGTGNLLISDSCNGRVRKVVFPGPAPAPSLSVAGGSYVGPQTITISDSLPNATFYFTTDGSTPDTGSEQSSGSVTVSQSETLKAIAVAPGYTESPLTSATYDITPATPVITWQTPAPITYGTALSSAILNATSPVPGTFAYSLHAGTVLSAGTHSVTATFTPTDNLGYTSASSTVQILVNQATPTITWSAPTPIPYGTPLGAAQLNATSSVAGSFTYSPTEGTVLDPGSHALHAAFTPEDAVDYQNTSATVTLFVKAVPTNLLQSSAPDTFVSNPVTFTATLKSGSGTPGGTVTFFDDTAAIGTATLTDGVAMYTSSSLSAGTHSITASYSGDSDFTSALSASITQRIEDFTVAAPSGDSTSATVQPGGTAKYTLSVTPPSGSKTPADITFTVSGLPAGATGTFNPTTVPAGSGATDVTLSVSVPAQSGAAVRPDAERFPLALGLLLLPLFGFRRNRRAIARTLLLLALAVTSAAAMATITGCGGSGSQSGTKPQPQTYTLKVTATAGSLTHTTNLTLTVE